MKAKRVKNFILLFITGFAVLGWIVSVLTISLNSPKPLIIGLICGAWLLLMASANGAGGEKDEEA